jgi:tripartite-type tricarboxylate transporter receptor subunit TctC
MIKLSVSIALVALQLALTGLAADAENWPAKPIRAIIPAGPGSTIDIVPRVVFEQLSAQLGQPIIAENRAGAGGTIGANQVAKSAPDGYTLLVNSSQHAISPSLYASLAYDTARDFAAVASLGVSASVLVVSPARGWKTIGDFVSAGKARPGSMNFSSVGIGSATHLSAERFRFSAGIDAVHIPYKGGAEAMFEVVAGRVDFFFGPIGLVLPNVQSGALIPLVVNGTRRAAALPDLPTTSEAGFKDAEYPFWIGIFLPAKTPREIVEKLHRETIQATRSPVLREKLAKLGIDPMEMAPEAFDELVRRDIQVNAALVKAVGIKPE